MLSSDEKNSNPWETEVYSQGRQINRWPHTELVSRVLHATAGQDPSKISVLELGCGTGNNLRFLAEEGFRTYGVEASPTAVKRALQLLEKDGLTSEIEIGDMASLPWADGHFDLILDRAALVHNARDRIHLILQEAWRVLKPGGRLISVGLKSVRHPELRFGQQSSEGTWTCFKKGKFRGLGAMSFCHESEIQDLFRCFEIECVERMTRSSPQQDILDEEFVVEVVRR
ncbi:class I SAM-dependent methyltransferase [Wenzhouxiangella sp. EGI_FJ10305]|uniref:class I SAM-dependent methyltransferase n=1 Tax=Wenzhouxiangella sp. EGI_FJ10305 TaxID=3243768 RepID=UPI0035DC5063